MTLRTPVIEMGVSNGAAVRADDLCEPIPGCIPLLPLSLSLHSFPSFCLVLFLRTALLSAHLFLLSSCGRM